MKTIIQIATNDPEQLLAIWEQLPDARVGGDVTAAGNPMILVDLTTPPDADDEHDLDGLTITTRITPASFEVDPAAFAAAVAKRDASRLDSSPVEEVPAPSSLPSPTGTSSGPHDDEPVGVEPADDQEQGGLQDDEPPAVPLTCQDHILAIVNAEPDVLFVLTDFAKAMPTYAEGTIGVNLSKLYNAGKVARPRPGTYQAIAS